jgi:hypothetical protein
VVRRIGPAPALATSPVQGRSCGLLLGGVAGAVQGCDAC